MDIKKKLRRREKRQKLAEQNKNSNKIYWVIGFIILLVFYCVTLYLLFMIYRKRLKPIDPDIMKKLFKNKEPTIEEYNDDSIDKYNSMTIE